MLTHRDQVQDALAGLEVGAADYIPKDSFEGVVMRTSHAGTVCRVHVASESDVITIRQDMRQFARGCGLGLAEQAKLSAAVGGVARSLLGQQGGATFTIKTVGEGSNRMLEVVCQVSVCTMFADAEAFAQAVRLDEKRVLVDEATVVQIGSTVALTMHIRLVRLPQT